MKKLLILIAVIGTFAFTTTDDEKGKIKWMTLEEAVEAQQKEPRKIIIDAYTTWCGPCKMLDKNTFQNKDVAEYINNNFYAVKFNAEGNETIQFKGKTYTNPGFDPNRKGRNSGHQLKDAFGVSAYPTILFLDENADIIMPLVGYQSPKQLELYLKLFKNDDHKNIKSKEEFKIYVDKFNYEFKE